MITAGRSWKTIAEKAVNYSSLVYGSAPNQGSASMPRSDRDISLMARLLKGRYGSHASKEAGRRADIKRGKGDREGALMWMMVLMAIEADGWRQKMKVRQGHRLGRRSIDSISRPRTT